jgi:hypothetical protein
MPPYLPLPACPITRGRGKIIAKLPLTNKNNATPTGKFFTVRPSNVEMIRTYGVGSVDKTGLERNSSQSADKLFGRNAGLSEDACESADFDFSVHRNDTPNGSASHNQMATLLPELNEAQPLERPNRLPPRNVGQLRHLPKHQTFW